MSTLAVDVLGVTLPSPLGSVAAANVRVDESIGAVSGADPRTRASARNLGAGAVGLDLTGILSEASQTAPPENETPATAATIPAIPAAPLLTATVSKSSAHARWAADDTCLPATTPLTTSTVSTADVSLLEIPGVGSLLDLPGTVSTTQSVTMEATGGANDQRSVVAQTSSNLVSANLFGSVNLGVSSAPQLTATATGLTGGATVTYNQPVVTVAAAGAPGSPYVLDAANETVAFALPENPLLGLELRLGALTKVEGSDGTSASGSAALLHVRLFVTNALTPDPADGTDVALVQLVPMAVTATAPGDGIACAEVDTTAPAVAILTPADGSSTTDTTPAVTGTTEPGASVSVTEGSTVICTTTADPTTGAWSCTPGTPLALGSHTFGATATDGAGNTATASTTFTITAPTPTPNPDRDGDGLPNQREGQLGTDPDNPDTDGDGLRDGHEVDETRTDPLKADTDRDGLTDGREVTGMKIRERFEVCGAKTRRWIRVTTDPLRRDTDRDGLRDGREVKGYVITQRVVINKAGESYASGGPGPTRPRLTPTETGSPTSRRRRVRPTGTPTPATRARGRWSERHRVRRRRLSVVRRDWRRPPRGDRRSVR